MPLWADDDRERGDLAGASVGEAILNELVKSYGFGRNSDGSWDWSVERIQKAWEEQPVWTALDYLAVAAPVLKWGTAVKAVSAGSRLAERGGRLLGGGANVVRKAMEAGEFARDASLGREALRGAGRVEKGLNALFGISDETARAAALYRQGASPWALRYARKSGSYRALGLNSPLTQEVSQDYASLIGRFDGEWWERRAVTQVLNRERQLQELATGRKVSEIAGTYTRELTQAQRDEVGALIGKWVDPGDPRVAQAVGGNRAALEAYRQDLGFRQWVHQSGFDLGWFDRKTFEEGLQNGYAPRVYAAWERQLARARTVAPGSFQGALDQARAVEGGGAAGKAAAPILGASARKAKRTLNEAQAAARDQILDPRVGLAKLIGAAQMVHRENYGRAVAESVVSATTEELRNKALQIAMDPTGRLARMHGITPKRLEAVRGIVGDSPEVNRALSMADNDVAKLLGWKRLGDLAAEGKGGGAFFRDLPEKLRDRWIDPAAVEDVVGHIEFLSDDRMWSTIHKNVVQTFQASKTAYNPATHVRNFLSGPIFSSLARGGPIKLAPTKGLRAWREGLKNADYRAWSEAIGAGAGFDPKTLESLDELVEGFAAGKGGTALDWMGDSRVARFIQGGAQKAEALYRASDEWWSLDSFIELTRKYGKDHTLEQARMLAARDIRKFMPNYAIQGDIANALREGVGGQRALAIPFVSFTSESARIWKNVLTEKPHMAFFWNHVFDSMGNTFGSIAGFSPDQLEEAKAALPEHTQGKKMTILPFNVDGQPQFLDVSYLIPLGNLGEAQQADQSFFGAALDVTANPIFSTVVAGVSGQDPFTGRELAPRFTERQLGVPVTSAPARRMVGLAEHMAAMMLPPLVPPGYAGVNLLEYVRGQQNPATGEPLEDGVVRTIAGNLFGFRGYQADVESQVLNVRAEQRRSNEMMSAAWQRWDFARYNGDPEAQQAEEQRLLELKMEQGFTQSEAMEYLQKQAKSREPFGGLSKRQMREILRRSNRLGPLSPEQEGIRSQLQRRLAGG